MLIPDYVPTKLTDSEGYLSSQWALFFSQLIQEMQINLSNEGYVLPKLTTANIAKLTDVDKSKGAMVYDTTTNQFKVNINGTWRVVQVV